MKGRCDIGFVENVNKLANGLKIDLAATIKDIYGRLTAIESNPPFTVSDQDKLDGIAFEATKNLADNVLLDRENHTGTESLDVTVDSATRKAMTGIEKDKLASVEYGANNYVHPEKHKLDIIDGMANPRTLMAVDPNGNNVFLKQITADMITETEDKMFPTKAQVDRVNSAELVTNKGKNGGYVPLNQWGKIDNKFLDSQPLVNLWETDSEEEMLALPAARGDICIRNDMGSIFLLKLEPASVLENWKFLNIVGVNSWNGKTGVVKASTDDVPEGEYNKYFSSHLIYEEIGQVIRPGTNIVVRKDPLRDVYYIDAEIESMDYMKLFNKPTINGHTIQGDMVITKADLKLDQVDNTKDLDKPISNATQLALNNKQDKLVTGTNIATINGQDILVSGNVEIGASWNKINGKPNTIDGYGITDAVSTSLIGAKGGIAALTNEGKLPLSYYPSEVDQVIEVNNKTDLPISGQKRTLYLVLSEDAFYRYSGGQYSKVAGNATLADEAIKLQNRRKITLAGTVTGYGYFDGSGDITINCSGGEECVGLAKSNTFTGSNTFTQKINGSISGNASTADRLSNARTIQLTGYVSGSATFDGSGNVSIYTSSSGSTSVDWNSINGKPNTVPGYNITDFSPKVQAEFSSSAFSNAVVSLLKSSPSNTGYILFPNRICLAWGGCSNMSNGHGVIYYPISFSQVFTTFAAPYADSVPCEGFASGTTSGSVASYNCRRFDGNHLDAIGWTLTIGLV